uniref:Uncharacterized protein n=1 Tax=Anguilla anguilla TaxID=7936 RepID=A0A0E9UCJ1_ANGAN
MVLLQLVSLRLNSSNLLTSCTCRHCSVSHNAPWWNFGG